MNCNIDERGTIDYIYCAEMIEIFGLAVIVNGMNKEKMHCMDFQLYFRHIINMFSKYQMFLFVSLKIEEQGKYFIK